MSEQCPVPDCEVCKAEACDHSQCNHIDDCAHWTGEACDCPLKDAN